jgi:hypothetical protein
MIDNTQITNYLQVMSKEWENDTEIFLVVSVICWSPIIHIEVEFKLSLAPLSRHDLIFEPSGQELTQYLDFTSVTFTAPTRWARTPHDQHRGSSTIFTESSTETTPEPSRRQQPPRVTSRWCLPIVPPSVSKDQMDISALGPLNHSLECNLKQRVWEFKLEDHKWAQCVLWMAKRALTHELLFYL